MPTSGLGDARAVAIPAAVVIDWLTDGGEAAPAANVAHDSQGTTRPAGHQQICRAARREPPPKDWWTGDSWCHRVCDADVQATWVGDVCQRSLVLAAGLCGSGA